MINRQPSSLDQAKVLCDFLINPHSLRTQSAFVDLCIRLTEISIKWRMLKGWKLPSEARKSEGGIRELAVGTVGFLLGVNRGKPFGEVFAFYRTRGIVDFGSVDSEELLTLLKVLITNHTKQELYDRGEEEDPQRANLKRRFKDILRPPVYREWQSTDDVAPLVGLAEPPGGLREGLDIIPYHVLLEVIDAAFINCGTKRTKWCRAIFDTLDGMSQYRNCCQKYELINAAISINLKYIDMEGIEYGSIPATQSGLMQDSADKARRQTLDWVQQNGLKTFVQTGKIDQQTADKFLLAIDCYLMDLIQSPAVDKLPVYFREVMPKSEHDRYRSNYKHLFETVVNGAREYFRNLMQGLSNLRGW